ncbi:threonine--tRNA ligase [Caulobacter sp. Root1455]|uniref:threonine--tRNA ligase n=1 Tax=unclassified Caulobacter TaxID=2648921 RepID=UPI0006FD8C76|nr:MULTISPECIES: threonine--tRNA ligase [unclassified Caulobacter]KQY35634.1 threonine--tRNA ligase [Caulobacter sp. Root487D2Y]KQZ06400.1 threonine--tRNA ligase [Caulobacter sp. Root1455]
MIDLIFPDGSARQYPDGATGRDVAASISKSLEKKALLIKLDGQLLDLDRPLTADLLGRGNRFEIITREAPEALEVIRHDTAHILAEAVQELFPGTQVTIGPNVEDGFYYDFARDEPFSLDDLPKIEERMRQIVDRDEKIRREEVERDAAIADFEAMGESYKAQIIRDLPVSDTITVYHQGEKWKDLCRGPHLPSTKAVGKAFKLTKLAGAYWRGDQNNAQLQRIYGTSWASEADLEAHLKRIEEAERRDHRKLGRTMDLFHIQEEGKGMVFWHPKGWTLYLALEAYMRRRLDAAGYREVKTPQILDKSLWEKSGHAEKFGHAMFMCESAEGEVLAVKPMNCPGHIQIFNVGQKSYRELPLRMAEFGACHRYEPSGAMHGIMRVRAFTQDDAHIFCREEQVTEESARFIELLRSVYNDLGMELADVKFSTRPDLRAGTDETWDKAEHALATAAEAAGERLVDQPGEGAFYGPKLEFSLKDAIGRVWQCGTLQLDFVLPERLDAEYVAEDGSKKRPVMLHRAILGSFERFIGILLENYAGHLPLWLAPVQVVVATITSDADDYAQRVAERLTSMGIRAEVDFRNEKINYKIREHSLAKVPVIAVVGRKEAENGEVALRRLGGEGQKVLSLEDAVRALTTEATPPDLARDRAVAAPAELAQA